MNVTVNGGRVVGVGGRKGETLLLLSCIHCQSIDNYLSGEPSWQIVDG